MSDDDAQLDELSSRIAQLSVAVPENLIIRSRQDCITMRQLTECQNEQEMLLEKRRVSEVVTAFENDHSGVRKSRFTECEACSKKLIVPHKDGLFSKDFMHDEDFDLQKDNIGHRVGMSLALCCGKSLCMECWGGHYALETCPGCNVGTMPNDEIAFRKTIEFAEKGNAWAQLEAGVRLLQKSSDMKNKKEKQKYINQGIEWYTKAADQGIAAAAGLLVVQYKKDIKDATEYRRLLELGAELGEPEAQMILGATCDEEESDANSAVKWYTLSVHETNSSLAAFNLASHFWEGTGGLNKSLPRAKHYYEIAADGGAENACYKLSNVLFEIGKDTMHVAGCCVIPRCLYWSKESAKRGDSDDVSRLVPTMMSMFRGKCAQCNEEGENFARCSRCKVFSYCSRRCQTEHWKDGHKYDCVVID